MMMMTMMLPSLPFLLLPLSSAHPSLLVQVTGFGLGATPTPTVPRCQTTTTIAVPRQEDSVAIFPRRRSRRRGEKTTTTSIRSSSSSDNSNTAGVLGGFGGNLQRAILAATALPFASHESDLPPPLRRLVSDRARTILTFCATYLETTNATKGWDADLFASGGYVRDLLLGRVSPDLDLSFNLQRCPKGVTVGTIAAGMDDFCRSRPDLGVESVEVVTKRSGTAESKDVDAEQVRLVIGGGGGGGGGGAREGRRVWEEEAEEEAEDEAEDEFDDEEEEMRAAYVDLLPTIGTETYTADDRIPHRDGRGSPEEDSLRRDLTVGSMLLRVTLVDKERSLELPRRLELPLRRTSATATAKGKEQTRTSKKDRDLRFVLLDYHGGIEDVATRTLRCPVPRNATLSTVWSEVIRTPDDADLANSLGFDFNPDRPDNDNTDKDAGKIQALWWAKMLRDDPYRLYRALRFSVTLRFRIDPTFWYAVPFVLGRRPSSSSTEGFNPNTMLADKVSHTRKVDELRKVTAGAGPPGLVQFLRMVLRPPIGGTELRDAFFACADMDNDRGSVIRSMGRINFDGAQRLARQLPPGLSVDEMVGAVLAVVFLSCRKEDCERDGGDDDTGGENAVAEANDGTKVTGPDDDASSAYLAARLGQTQRLVEAACEGLRAPASIWLVAIGPLSVACRLLDPPLPILGMHSLLARAVPWPVPSVPVSMDDRARQFATMVRLWDVLRLDPLNARRQQNPSASSDPRWVLTLIAAAAVGGGSPSNSNRGDGTPLSRSREQDASETARRLEADLRLLLSSSSRGDGAVVGPQPQGGARLGGAVAGLAEVPPHLRSQVMGAVHVLTRLRGDTPTIETPDQLRTYLQTDCDCLLAKLADEWWASGVGGDGTDDEKNGGGSGWAGGELRSPYAKK